MIAWRRGRTALGALATFMVVLVLACGPALATDQPSASGEEQTTVAATDAGQGGTREDSAQTPLITPAVQKKMRVSVRFVGTDGTWTSANKLSLPEGASAWYATREALTKVGLPYRTGAAGTQDVIVSLSKEDGTTLAADFSTGSGWHLYLNGERCHGSSSTVELAEGDVVEWRYELGTIVVTVSVVGPGGTGDSYWIPPTSVRLDASQTGWDASRTVFVQNGYEGRNLISYSNGPNGEVWLDSLNALGENGITGESWQLFVNGSLATTDAAHVNLRSGDSLCWYYAGRGVAVLPSFVSSTGAAAQNPAASVSIDGFVTQAWAHAGLTQAKGRLVLDRLRGLTLDVADVATLAWEGTHLMDPLAQVSGGYGWHGSLPHLLDGRMRRGEGGQSLMAVGGGMYYVGNEGSLVRLEVR